MSVTVARIVDVQNCAWGIALADSERNQRSARNFDGARLPLLLAFCNFSDVRDYSIEELRQLASLELQTEELCRKQAWKIANATAPPAQRVLTVRRYEQIALTLIALRPKPLSAEQVKSFKAAEGRMLRGAQLTKAEAATEARLRRVESNRNSSDEERRSAEKERAALWEEVEARAARLRTDCIAAKRVGGTWQPEDRRGTGALAGTATTAHRLLARRERDGGERKLFADLASCIRRYLLAREKRAAWVEHLPLLHVLAVEWLRDDQALFGFLAKCFKTWGDLKSNPQSNLRRRTLIHQLAATHGHDANALHKSLERLDAFPPVTSNVEIISESRRKRINKDISRGLRKARARRFGGW